MHAVHSPQRQRMRRNLHHARPASGSDHLPHQLLHVRCLRCGARRLEFTVADPVRHRANQSTACARCLEDRADQVARRRLAVRAGDADDLHRPARVALEIGGEQRERPPRVLDDDPGHADVPVLSAPASATTALAPAATACAANAAPSALRPRSATKIVPGRARRESCVTPVHGTSSACALSRHRGSLIRRQRRRQPLQQLAHGHGRASATPRDATCRSNQSVPDAPRSMGVPAAGCCATTMPAPCSLPVRPSRASVRNASRALNPRRSGKSEVEPVGGRASVTTAGRPAGPAAGVGCLGPPTSCLATSTGGGGVNRGRNTAVAQGGVRDALEDGRRNDATEGGSRRAANRGPR